VDAESGEVLRKYDGRQTGQGTGVKGDTKSLSGPDPVATSDDLTTFDAGAGHWELLSKNNRQQTFDARNGTFFAYAATDADNDWTLVTSIALRRSARPRGRALLRVRHHCYCASARPGSPAARDGVRRPTALGCSAPSGRWLRGWAR
jgi:hypothetical protein